MTVATELARPGRDWSEAHGGSLTANCRTALSFHVEEVGNWIAAEGEKSTGILVTLAYVVAPYTSRVAQHDSKVWIRTLHAPRENQRKNDAEYVESFLFALALCNAPGRSSFVRAGSPARRRTAAER